MKTTESLRRNSAARFVAEVLGLLFGIFAGIITARVLGPSGKGLFSSLALLAMIMMWLCSLGLGEAAVVLTGQGRATMKESVATTILAAFCCSLLGSSLLWIIGMFAFSADWHDMKSPILLASLLMPLTVLNFVVSFLLSAQNRVVAHSVTVATTAVMTGIGLLLFVWIIPLGVFGGVLGNGFGSLLGLILAIVLVSRSKLSLRPRLHRGYLIAALRFGLPVALSYVVTIMFLRVDLLLVYRLAGSEAAGQYSVALGLAALVALLPNSISAGTFPRLAQLENEQANELIAQACRYGMAAAFSAMVFLLAITPIVVPLLFGRGYTPAIIPMMILLPGSFLWSSQWILSRAAAARGKPGLLVGSFLLGLIVMCAMDYALIPTAGTKGAAFAALIAPAVGFVVCLFYYYRSPTWEISLMRIFPRPHDFKEFVARSLDLFPFLHRKGTAVPVIDKGVDPLDTPTTQM